MPDINGRFWLAVWFPRFSLPVDFQHQHSRLEQLAGWAMNYSSEVSIQQPDALLLELGGSIRLFAGLDALLKRISTALSVFWGLEHRLALTPVPAASLLLARCIDDITSESCIECAGGVRYLCIETLPALRAILGGLRLQRAGLQPGLVERLAAMGIRCFQDLWRLPAAGLEQRFGGRFRQWLEALTGPAAALPDRFRPAEVFFAEHCFPVEVRTRCLLAPAIDKLVAELVCFLRNRDLALEQLQCEFRHHGAKATCIEVRFSQSSRDRQRILLLIEEHMENLVLPLPVSALSLSAEAFSPYQPVYTGLFAAAAAAAPGGGGDAGEWPQLIEQLQARLGGEIVSRLQVIDEHRPEKAWKHLHGLVQPPAVAAAQSAGGRHGESSDDSAWSRPVWLLPAPRVLYCAHGKVYYQGKELLLSTAERIESGWWDGEDIRRDYYYAMNRHGSGLWVFRDLESGRWYLHGVFA